MSSARALCSYVSSAHTHRPHTASLAPLGRSPALERSPLCLLAGWLLLSLRSFSFSLPLQQLHSTTLQPLFSTPPLSQHRLSQPLHSFRSAPFSGVFSSLRQSGADTLPSFVTVTGSYTRRLRCRRLSLACCSFGGKPRRSRTTALFARGVLGGKPRRSPSIPRGMSPHDARSMVLVFDGVAL